jgi:hypothetical protein
MILWRIHRSILTMQGANHRTSDQLWYSPLRWSGVVFASSSGYAQGMTTVGAGKNVEKNSYCRCGFN